MGPPRDFVDVFALSWRLTKAELLDRAAEIDVEFSRSVFADMLDSLARYSDAALPSATSTSASCGSSSVPGRPNCARTNHAPNGPGTRTGHSHATMTGSAHVCTTAMTP